MAGGELGGDGGFVEVSAPLMAAIRSEIDGHAEAGYRGGRLLIDPQDIVIGGTGSGGIGSGTVGSGDPPIPGTLNLDVNSAFLGFSQITLQATRNLTLASGVTWDLVASTGLSEPGSLLKLEAGNNITLASGASILAGAELVGDPSGRARLSVAERGDARRGNISFAGTGSLEAQNGNINLLAGNNITVAGGHVRTVAGGNLSAIAVAGSINTGTKANGFLFLSTGYSVSSDLGGISTANGGDVSLTAGQDILSFLPFAGGIQTDAGSGAFGAAPGNVTINAGRDVAGHYVVRNGVGSITAGRNAGTASRLLALSLVSGGWTVNAANDVLLQEVRNPNGVFNNLGSSTSANRSRFDYALDAYTVLNGGNSVQLRGTALPRYNDAFSQGMPPIYPGTLEVTRRRGRRSSRQRRGIVSLAARQFGDHHDRRRLLGRHEKQRLDATHPVGQRQDAVQAGGRFRHRGSRDDPGASQRSRTSPPQHFRRHERHPARGGQACGNQRRRRHDQQPVRWAEPARRRRHAALTSPGTSSIETSSPA